MSKNVHRTRYALLGAATIYNKGLRRLKYSAQEAESPSSFTLSSSHEVPSLPIDVLVSTWVAYIQLLLLNKQIC